MIETIFSPLMMTMPRALLISFSGSPRRIRGGFRCDTLLFGLYSSEFLTLAQNDVEMLVVGEEGSEEHSIVLYGDSDTVVDPLKEFALLGHLNWMRIFLIE